MRRKIKIAPSLLTISDLSQLEEKVRELETAGADMFHIDVMDGIFVSAKTPFLDPAVTERIATVTEQELDVHLMVQRPADYIDRFIDAGAKIVTIHAESEGDISGLLQKIKGRGVKAGLAINPATALDERVIEYCRNADMILLMTVVPGEAGQSYIEEVEPKIQTARRLFPDKDIQVDGGVKEENACVPIIAGANILVSGTGILSQSDYKKVMNTMREFFIIDSSKDVSYDLVIGSDHAGYDLKEAVKAWLVGQTKICFDVGTYNKDSCNYPVYARRVAELIKRRYAPHGILICGTGQGMSIAANRYGVRAALTTSVELAEMAKKHNNAQVLCLGARYTTIEQAQKYITAWMNATYEGITLEGERHQRRLDMIEQ